ncbi:MAG: alkaline phosphatase family protein [Planctomycetota bacterium]
MTEKILMIGLDGATFDVINPLIEGGWMPNLAALIAKGASGRMLSTVPPISGPAWLSLATGMKPESTSIYDFTYRKGDSYELQPISSSDFAGRSIWDILGRAGKQVGILNYPMLIPPYEVNGFMSAGLWASQDGEFTFPADLKEELNRAADGKYELSVNYHNSCYEDTALFLDDLERVLAKKLLAAKCLMKEKPWDFFWLVLSETDWLQHLMWRHIDRNHPLHEGRKSEKFHRRFKEVWRRIDEAIAELNVIAGEQADMFIFSDHGFGPNEEVFRLNVWLEREGYLVWRKNSNKTLSRTKSTASAWCKEVARALRLNKIAPRLYDYGRKTKSKLIEKVVDQIDLTRSMAFDPGHTIPFGGIYINDRLAGTAEKKRRVSREIVEKLQNWASANGVKVETKQKCDLPVDQQSAGPDVLIGINDYRCVLLKDRFDGEVFERRPYTSRHSGSHRMDGIFIGVGPDIQNCTMDESHIYDIAPTILYLLDLPVPPSMDGQVLTTIVSEQFLSSHPVNMASETRDSESTDSVGSTKELTQDEKDAIQRQLEDLGYM